MVEREGRSRQVVDGEEGADVVEEEDSNTISIKCTHAHYRHYLGLQYMLAVCTHTVVPEND